MKHLQHLLAKPSLRILGLMSGTSLDGIDLADVQISHQNEVGWKIKLLGFECTEMPLKTRQQILRIMANAGQPTNILQQISSLHQDLGRLYGQTVLNYLSHNQIKIADIDLIGSHGQTIQHESGVSTWQIGEADQISAMTNLPVVYDFRSADLAVGGTGAPLVPNLDRILAEQLKGNIVFQNLGGIANLCFVPADRTQPVIAFDTGPANISLNSMLNLHSNGLEFCDYNAKYSKQGQVIQPLLQQWLKLDYLQKKPPKSTGEEQFGQAFAKKTLATNTQYSFVDLMRTLVAFSAASIVKAYHDFLPKIDLVLLSGGGVHHPLLTQEIQQRLQPVLVRRLDEATGINPDAKEAIAFAVLAFQRIYAMPSNLPEVTGSSRKACLGKLACCLKLNS